MFWFCLYPLNIIDCLCALRAALLTVDSWGGSCRAIAVSLIDDERDEIDKEEQEENEKGEEDEHP